MKYKEVRIFDEVLNQVESEKENKYVIMITDYINEETANAINLPDKCEDCEYLMFGHSAMDMNIDWELDVIFTLDNLSGFEEMKMKIKNMYIDRGDPVEIVPILTGGEILIEFEGGKPDILDKLNSFSLTKPFERTGQNIYLTNQSTMTEIIKQYKNKG